MLFSGYRGDLELTAKVLVAGRFLTDDRGEWQTGPTGRRLKVLGRLDDVVISGGINVDLARVQRVVDRLGVGEVAVVAVPDPEWGVRIVLVSERDALPLDWWRTALRTKIGEAGLPREVVEVTRLPRTTSGKLDRQRIKRLVMNREPR